MRYTRSFSCGMNAGSSSPTRDQTQAPCIGSAESYPLDHQGSPLNLLINAPFLGISPFPVHFSHFLICASRDHFLNKLYESQVLVSESAFGGTQTKTLYLQVLHQIHGSITCWLTHICSFSPFRSMPWGFIHRSLGWLIQVRCTQWVLNK